MPASTAFPLAFVGSDSAFGACMRIAIDTPELVEQFDRLYGTSLSKGQVEEGDMRAFVTFVYHDIYLPQSDSTLNALRLRARSH